MSESYRGSVSLSRGGGRAGGRGGGPSLKPEDESKTYSYANLCRDHFRNPNSSTQFSRKDLTQPLLKHTPDSDKEVISKIWRTVVRFVTDDSDDNGSSSASSTLSRSSQRPQRQGSASVTLRLSQEASYELAKDSLTAISEDKLQTETESSLSGTWNTVRLKQLKEKLRQGLRRSSRTNFYNSSSLEDSLVTSFEQVQYVIGWGLLKPALRDEIYCMVLRQLTNNPQKNGRVRGWILLGLIVGIFLPSDKIFLYVARFIDEAPSMSSSTLKKLFVRGITDGARHQPPASLEYTSAMERKPMELQVRLMDGGVHMVPVDSAVSCSEIISNISKAIDLKEKFGFCLFIAMENKVTSLGSDGDKVFDAISQCEQIFRNQYSLPESDAPWRLFLRKEMFSPWDDVTPDPVATSLVYAQITRGIVLEEYTCTSNSELATLAAKQYYCEFENDVSESGLVNLLCAYVPSRKISDNAKLRLWARQVAMRYRKMYDLSDDIDGRPLVDEVKSGVVSWAKVKWTMSFSRYFQVRCLEGPKTDSDGEFLTMAINSSGMTLLTNDGRKLLDVTFAQISSIIGEGQDPELRSISGDVVIVILAEGALLKFETMDANDIYRLITYSINGVKERSTWALAKRDYDGSLKGHLTISEGDLLSLVQPAKEEAMTSSTAACTNMVDLRSGRLPTEQLHVIATLDEPKEEILRLFRSPCYYSKRRASAAATPPETDDTSADEDPATDLDDEQLNRGQSSATRSIPNNCDSGQLTSQVTDCADEMTGSRAATESHSDPARIAGGDGRSCSAASAAAARGLALCHQPEDIDL